MNNDVLVIRVPNGFDVYVFGDLTWGNQFDNALQAADFGSEVAREYYYRPRLTH